MNALDRYNLLLFVLNKLKKASSNFLQGLFFLLTRIGVPTGYEFINHSNGIKSPDLSSDIGVLIDMGLITSTYKNGEPYLFPAAERIVQYNIKTGEIGTIDVDDEIDVINKMLEVSERNGIDIIRCGNIVFYLDNTDDYEEFYSIMESIKQPVLSDDIGISVNFVMRMAEYYGKKNN